MVSVVVSSLGGVGVVVIVVCCVCGCCCDDALLLLRLIVGVGCDVVILFFHWVYVSVYGVCA